MGLKPMELLLIFAVLLLLFGGSRLPTLGAALGQSIRNFKKGFGEGSAEEPEQKRSQDALSSTSSVERDVREKSHTRQG